ncbi:glycine-rich protein 1-like [Panicum virgatum]|uniref:glycine-rich protein 1-like n=1 Tax=Panicum virgatum TaxID=38727 RepID=UPI0019D5D314|nr:glycine-rich protein 1-like [Panicum virgatum]
MAGRRPGGENPEGRARAGAAGTCEAACGEDGATSGEAGVTGAAAGATSGVVEGATGATSGAHRVGWGNPGGGPTGWERTPAEATRGPADVVIVAMVSSAMATRGPAEENVTSWAIASWAAVPVRGPVDEDGASGAACGMREAAAGGASRAACGMREAAAGGASRAARGARDASEAPGE